jgi:hypothetical protein
MTSLRRHFRLALLWLLLTGASLGATGFETSAVKGLEGRDVLLLVGPDKATQGQADHYHSLLSRAGADPSKYPVYRTSRLANEIAGKLGLSGRGENYAVLVRWGNPARFGPARVLPPGVVTSLASDADMFFLVDSAMTLAGQAGLLEKLPADLADLRPRAQLVIEHADFQANGKPVYLVNTKVRVRNEGKLPAKMVNLLFEVQNPDGSWFELGRHAGLEIRPGQTITRDLVRTTHDTPLLGDNKEILPATYRVRIEYQGGQLEKSGQFVPRLLEDQTP